MGFKGAAVVSSLNTWRQYLGLIMYKPMKRNELCCGLARQIIFPVRSRSLNAIRKASGRSSADNESINSLADRSYMDYSKTKQAYQFLKPFDVSCILPVI